MTQMVELFLVLIFLVAALQIVWGMIMNDRVKGMTIEIERSHKYEKEILKGQHRLLFAISRLTDVERESLEVQKNILRVLNRIDAKTPPIDLAGSILFNDDDGQKVDSMNFQDDADPKHFVLKIVDKKGKDAKVDGAPVWSSSDESIATVVADADGMGATVTITGELGECLVSATADADLGEGVSAIIGTLPVTVTAGPAVEVQINEG